MERGYAAYGQTHKNSLQGRALEGEAFMKAVRLLTRAQDRPGNKRFLQEALDYTQKLWTIVQADLKSPSNHLDESLKSNLLSLSLYVDRECMAAAKSPQRLNLRGLIDVNNDVARGLLSTGD
ncbi:flagellar biosynthesis regulator FlaF [Terasakiella sp. SH-1]|uniref:flagellar biosynthesis regulator FlaF n=1 Tax=Terasakiella sp. SH-1 TaxID=2560057 RepID=UPI0010749813|nr:flagellar biosynthesis regulator FlaF [Terasakiella sp. SH-1]